MTNVRYIFSMYDIQMDIRNSLRPHVGVAIDVADVSPIVISAFEYCISGRLIESNETPFELLYQYPVPSTVINDLLTRVYRAIEFYLKQANIAYDGSCEYHFTVHDWSDIVVDVRKKPVVPVNRVDQFKAMVINDMENGDWFSEKIRRFVGLP